MEIVYVYTKKRSEFGRQPIFSDYPPELCADIKPDPSLKDDFIYKDPVDVAIQYTSEMSEHEVEKEILMHMKLKCVSLFRLTLSGLRQRIEE